MLRVASSFMLALAPGVKVTCADAVKKLLKGRRGWEVRSVGGGSKGERWYAWAWLGTASPRHSLLVRRHLKTGELAFHYCFVPEGQLASKARLIRAAGLRWPVEAPPRRTEAPPPARSGDKPPADPGLVPLSVREVKHLLADALHRPQPPGHAARWLQWRRRHQARSRWFHQRARLARNYALVS